MSLETGDDFVAALSSLAADNGEQCTIRIALISNITTNPILDTYLRYYLLQENIRAELKHLSIDETLYALTSHEAAPIPEPIDYVIVVPHTRPFLNPSHPTEPLQQDHTRSLLISLLQGIRRSTPAIIVYCALEQLEALEEVFHASRGSSHSKQSVNELNQAIEQQISKIHNLFIIDVNPLLLKYGTMQLYDNRLWHWTKNPYSRLGSSVVARQIAAQITALYGIDRKCIVLDCDGVLWGGTVGEEGMDGIRLAPTHPGSSYFEFQSELLRCHERGMVLALCSKNNLEDVLDTVRHHPYMLLREQHIAAYAVNWEDKADNIRQLSVELNITLDQMIFMDDSEFEIERIRQALPQVRTVLLPRMHPDRYRSLLLDMPELLVRQQTAEDSSRTRMYQQEQDRRQFREEYAPDSLEEYLRSLQLRASFIEADTMTIPRIAQLTQKTNQFNLAAVRYTEDDIRCFSQNEDFEVLGMNASDRFGDMGLIGVAMVRYVNQEGWIELFLLSCRALGRTLEDTLLLHVLARVRRKGVTCLYAVRVPSKKNEQTASFYPDHGFELVAQHARQTLYRCNPEELDEHKLFPARFVEERYDKDQAEVNLHASH
ncbi:HAD-IIIC family phosphatase [Paenibacillus massiliensis]|uniref:HAD-IIIC family phosphatase n=1 Tax=Paenibacillus massiliensis TaxID=225917 RepID=UPI000381E8AD|nr:HAD-IIIC family phosphatase [Paenibacillus massiliensis]